MTPSPRIVMYIVRGLALAAATTALILAIIGSEKTIQDIAELVTGAIADDSAAADDLQHWTRAALVLVAGLLVLIRGLWADVVVAVSTALVIAAVIGAYGNTDAAREKPMVRDVDPPPLTRGATRFTLPQAKVQSPGTDMTLARLRTPGKEKDAQSTLPVSVVLVVPVRDRDNRTLRREPRVHEGQLAKSVAAAGPKEAVPVDITTDEPQFAADLTAATQIYLLRRP